MNDDSSNLDEVYGAKDSKATREAYEGWAAGYDAENIGNGYRVPGIGCALFARHVDRNGGPVFDAACGTGIIGGVLDLLGYQDLVGSDLSPAMLELADTLSVYQNLYEHDLANPLPEADNTYNAVICFGSLGPGHAPADCLDEFVRVTRSGGHVVFNTRAETYAKQDLKNKVEEIEATGKWLLAERSPIFRSYYLVEPDVTSQVYVFKVC
jgi:SAM-dependent methyltransferase